MRFLNNIAVPVRLGFRQFQVSLRALITNPLLIPLLIFAIGVIVGGMFLLYFLEKDINPNIHSMVDTLWWSVATATSGRFSDLGPLTTLGKWLGIVIMLIGAALFWAFTALFAAVFLSAEVRKIEREAREDEEVLDRHMRQLESALRELRKWRELDEKEPP